MLMYNEGHSEHICSGSQRTCSLSLRQTSEDCAQKRVERSDGLFREPVDYQHEEVRFKYIFPVDFDEFCTRWRLQRVRSACALWTHRKIELSDVPSQLMSSPSQLRATSSMSDTANWGCKGGSLACWLAGLDNLGLGLQRCHANWPWFVAFGSGGRCCGLPLGMVAW
eukprot:2279149-Amphidinium_carterae.1